jgi:hypothetical protein
MVGSEQEVRRGRGESGFEKFTPVHLVPVAMSEMQPRDFGTIGTDCNRCTKIA